LPAVEWAIPAIALVVLGFAAVSGLVNGTPITAAIVFTGFGLLLGPNVFGVVDPAPNGETVKLLAESTLAVVLFGDAARIDLNALWEERPLPERPFGLALSLEL